MSNRSTSEKKEHEYSCIGREEEGQFHFLIPIMLCIIVLWGGMQIAATCSMRFFSQYFLIRQMYWLAVGMIVFTLTSILPFQKWLKFSPFFLGGICLCLCILLIAGTKTNGSTGWFRLWNSIYLQPSEFTKTILILYLSQQGEKISEYKKRNIDWKVFLNMSIPTMICCLLVLAEPDFCSFLLFFISFVIIFYISGGSIVQLLLAVCAALVPVIPFLIWKPYAWNRIISFFQNGSWHHDQFRYALARGGLFGCGDGGSYWANFYLPFSHTDSIYAAIVERTGLIGGVLVLVLFLFICFCFLRLSLRAGSRAGKIFIFSSGCMIMVQALLHISVNVLLLPTTGVTLPFISYGGSSLLSCMLMMGIVFSALKRH